MAGDPHRLVGVINAANRPKAEDAEAVHAYLFEAIVDQRLPPGAKLTEQSLVEHFDIARPAINSALKRPVWERLAGAPPKRGKNKTGDLTARRRVSGPVQNCQRPACDCQRKSEYQQALAVLASPSGSTRNAERKSTVRSGVPDCGD